MQIFGIVTLLLSIALIGVIFVQLGPTSTGVSTDLSDVAGGSGEVENKNIIQAAQEIVDNNKRDFSLSSESVFVYSHISVPLDTRVLDLSGRNLSGSLNAEINQLKGLKVLDISDNKFTGVPAEVGQLSNLEELNLANNPITGLPYEIGSLRKLKVLDLRGTQYSQIDLIKIERDLPESTVILVD